MTRTGGGSKPRIWGDALRGVAGLPSISMHHARPLPSPEWTEALERYGAWLTITVSAGTVRLRLLHLRRYAIETARAPFSVSVDELAGYLAGHPWAAGTLRSFSASLRSFYAWAVATGRIEADPTEQLPRTPFVPGRPRPAPESVVAGALATRDARSRLMVRLAAEAGLRCCEIARVHCRDVQRDLVGWSLLVHGKGDRERIVPLNDGLAAELRGRAEEGYLFPGQIDGHLSPGHVSRLVSAALPGEYTAHQLRHRFGSRAYAGTGGDIRAVQELLGHASVATTQIYTAIPDGALRRGVLAAAV